MQVNTNSSGFFGVFFFSVMNDLNHILFFYLFPNIVETLIRANYTLRNGMERNNFRGTQWGIHIKL